MRIVDLSETLDLDAVDNLLPSSSEETDLSQAIADIVAGVRKGGDTALLDYTKRFDGCTLKPEELRVSQDEIAEYASGADDELVDILEVAISNIRQCHE